MDKKLITSLQDNFNAISNFVDGTEIEFWYARELQQGLGYQSWDKFLNVIEKAEISCENLKVEVSDHFRQVGKMVTISFGSKKSYKHRKYLTIFCQICIIVNILYKKDIHASGKLFSC